MEAEEYKRKKKGKGDIQEDTIGEDVGRLIICKRGENGKSRKKYFK